MAPPPPARDRNAYDRLALKHWPRGHRVLVCSLTGGTGRTTVAALLAKGELRPLHLSSDDLDATFAKVAAAPGAAIVQEPADQPWGVRDGAVRDPAGNLIRIEAR